MNQKRNIIAFIAASLDGYIATKNESLDWLFKVEGDGDNGFSDFYETVDTILMGRRTYDWIMKQDLKGFPYKGKECYVFTRNSIEDTEDVKFVHGDDLTKLVTKLKGQHGKKIWMVGGGELLHTFIQNKFMDEFIITIAPTILGQGIPLFHEEDEELDLILKGTNTFNQFVELHYEVKK